MNYKKGIIPLLLMFFLSVTITETFSQNNNLMRRLPRGGSGGGSGDSIAHRTGLEDSITINFRYLDSSRMRKFDSSILDFAQRFPVPSDHYHLGNIGNATHSMVYSKLMRAGWDNGFHAYDSYILNDYDTRFYNTTRPYTEIQYQFGSRYEQMLGALHTQNILPNWNASFQYRMINSTGFYQNQNTSHNNYRFGSWFQSKNKRYQNFIVVVGNKLLSGENGGIKDEAYLDSAAYKERSTIPTRLGGNTAANRNLFSSDIGTGTKYTTASFLMRQQYDFIGNKDSIVTDSSVIPLFYPRLRGEYTINYRTYNYRFTDPAPGQSTEFYGQKYGILIDSTVPNYYLQDYWSELLNDFSIYQFPDAKNSQQFVKLGATMQLLTGKFDSGTVKSKYHNFFLHGEYRNRTRNQKWDVEAFGDFYVNGLNTGDYEAHISLKRLISKDIGSLQLGFGNVNRTPSFTFNGQSSFYIGTPENFNKENNTEIYGMYELPKLKLRLTGRYLLLSNFTYYRDFKQPAQYNTLFNVLQVSAEKSFRLTKDFNWRTWVIVQQPTGSAPLNLPLIFTKNQISYDGNLGFKNLRTSFGFEIRYWTPYNGDGYSPLLGQFFNQNNEKIKLNFPETAGYMHFRIKSFTAYIRVENLNSLDLSAGGFVNNNIVSPNYPYPGLLFRVGIYWSFVN